MSNPFQHEARRRFTPHQRAAFFAAADGRCAKCTRKIMTGEDWDLDHRIALENGGTNDDHNMQVVCPFCHDDKTPDDHAAAGKSRRAYTKSVVPKRFRDGRGWRR